MTKSELNKYRNILEAKQAELEQLVRNRDGIAIEKRHWTKERTGQK